jgi:hypothetical protein
VTERRFPPPWTVEELEACFVVQDASGQKLGYLYYEEEPAGVLRIIARSEDRVRRYRPRY